MEVDEKAYSDEDESWLKRAKSNGFMHQVHQQRKHSFSYSKQDESSDSEDSPNNNNYHEPDGPDISAFKPPHLPHLPSNNLNLLKRQQTENLLHSRPTKLERRHSADKVLCKPTTKNINSPDYLNKMVISLRSKITTYKEDLRIAGELGQKLFSQNAAKDDKIEQYKAECRELKRENEELFIEKNQLLQTTQIDAEHTKRLETDLQRQKTSHTDTRTKYLEQNVLLKEQLAHALDDVRHWTQMSEDQRLEIETLETRNEQISQNALETIDDLRAELAEEKDGHSNWKHKYGKLRNEFTKLKINYEKRGTDINNLKKSAQEKELKILSLTSIMDKDQQRSNEEMESNQAQQIKLLHRQIDNYKDEMEGITMHLMQCKKYLQTTMTYLESTGLLMKSPLQPEHGLNVDEIYNLCENTRKFLGIDQAPPNPVYPEETPDAPPPDLPRDRSAEPLPTDDNEPLTPSMPRELTPELKVSQREIVPVAPPPPKISATPPPSQPTQPNIRPPSPKLPPPTSPKHKPVRINHKASLPPSIPSIPSTPDDIKPQLPNILPPPRTPKSAPKQHNLGMMPQAINNIPSLPAPAAPAPPSNPTIPALPNEVRSKPKSFSSAIQPKEVTFFPAPSTPKQPHNLPMPTSPDMKSRINAKPNMPNIPPPAPRTPSRSEMPRIPSPKQPTPRSQTHHSAAMPTAVADEKPSLSAPSVPSSIYNNPLPQEPEPRHIAKISAAAMAPPSLPEEPTEAPSMNDMPPSLPQEREVEPMQSLQSGVATNNEIKPMPKPKPKPKPKKKKKSKKVKKERDSVEDQKQHLTVFFSTYSDNKNWEEGGKENGVQKYILKFANREPLNARMAFLYSMTLYLGQIVGINKRCISHAFMLLKSVKAQIDTLCDEFALILQTLEHHNDDKLWKYIYSFLYNAAAYFKHIQRFVGNRVPVDNPKKYSRALKSGSRDYTIRTNRRESSFRKLSGLSEVSGQSIDYHSANHSNVSGLSNNANRSNRTVYGSIGNTPDTNNNTSLKPSISTGRGHAKSKKSSKKKKNSSSYA